MSAASAMGAVMPAGQSVTDHAPSTPRGGDRVLFGAVVALALIGLVLVASSSSAIALDRFGSASHYTVRHALHLVIGVCALVALARLDYRVLDNSRLVHAIWAVALGLLVTCLFFAPAGGASRWIRLGPLGFQPSEIAKLALVLVTAFQLARRRDALADWTRGLLPPAILCAQMALLVALQPDFGTTAIMAMLFGLLALVAGTPWRVLAAYGASGVAALGVFLVQEPYRLARLHSFLDPSADPLGSGFQLRQSLIALGTGGIVGRSHDGLLGTGLTTSIQKLFFLPEPHTDFAFAVLGEELGLLGMLAVIVLFAIVLVRGLRIAASATTEFGTLLATGCTAMIAFQALMNIAVVTGLLPTKGVPLPFLSCGGSSLVMSCAAVGLLLSVSRHG